MSLFYQYSLVCANVFTLVNLSKELLCRIRRNLVNPESRKITVIFITFPVNSLLIMVCVLLHKIFIFYCSILPAFPERPTQIFPSRWNNHHLLKVWILQTYKIVFNCALDFIPIGIRRAVQTGKMKYLCAFVAILSFDLPLAISPASPKCLWKHETVQAQTTQEISSEQLKGKSSCAPMASAFKCCF